MHWLELYKGSHPFRDVSGRVLSSANMAKIYKQHMEKVGNCVPWALIGRTATIGHIYGPGWCNRMREGEGHD